MAKATAAIADAAITIASATPRPQPRRCVGTRRSSALTGSRTTWTTTVRVTSTTAAAAAATATTNPVPSSKRADPGRNTCRASHESPSEASAPASTPVSATGSSSPSSSPAAPRAPRPRSRASAISGRRCSVAAPSTSQRTTSASNPSCTISSGTMTCAWSRAPATSSAMSGSPENGIGADFWDRSPAVTCPWRRYVVRAGPSRSSSSTPTAGRSSGKSSSTVGASHTGASGPVRVAAAVSRSSVCGCPVSGSELPERPLTSRPNQ